MKHVGENITEFLDVISVDEFFKNSDVTGFRSWKSREIVEKVYTDSLPSELNKSAVNKVHGLMKNLEKI